MNGKRMLCQTKRKHTEFIRIRWTDYYNRMAAENKANVEFHLHLTHAKMEIFRLNQKSTDSNIFHIIQFSMTSLICGKNLWPHHCLLFIYEFVTMYFFCHFFFFSILWLCLFIWTRCWWGLGICDKARRFIGEYGRRKWECIPRSRNISSEIFGQLNS